MNSQLSRNYRSGIRIYLILEAITSYFKSLWLHSWHWITKKNPVIERDQKATFISADTEVLYEEQAFYTLFRDDDTFKTAYGHTDNPLTN